MKHSRVSMGWLMVGVALLGVPLALVLHPLNGRSLLSGNAMYDLGFWPGLVAFPAASYELLRRRGRRSPFLWGFTATGWVSVLAYLACCFAMTHLVNELILFYVNDIDYWWMAWLTDADRTELYAINLLVLGLFLAAPQLLTATLGGLIARRYWGARWIST